MTSMTYCRHENAAAELDQVWELWEDGPGNEYEERARKRLILLIREMHEQFEFDGTYDELDA